MEGIDQREKKVNLLTLYHLLTIELTLFVCFGSTASNATVNLDTALNCMA